MRWRRQMENGRLDFLDTTFKLLLRVSRDFDLTCCFLLCLPEVMDVLCRTIYAGTTQTATSFLQQGKSNPRKPNTNTITSESWRFTKTSCWIPSQKQKSGFLLKLVSFELYGDDIAKCPDSVFLRSGFCVRLQNMHDYDRSWEGMIALQFLRPLHTKTNLSRYPSETEGSSEALDASRIVVRAGQASQALFAYKENQKGNRRRWLSSRHLIAQQCRHSAHIHGIVEIRLRSTICMGYGSVIL